jgi:geranylgeranyl reductase family protein
VKTVAVLGGGPAGAFAAERLASAGVRTLLFDEKLAWEKPCGGGVTYKAYQEYPFLIHNDAPKCVVTHTTIAAPRAGEAKMELSRPLLVYARKDLNGLLLNRAENAGASIEKTRVLGLERRGGGWKIRTRDGVAEADFCVLAMGARNPLKQMGTEFVNGDTMTTLGYFVPAEQPHIDIQFLPEFQGYIWVFPRPGHLSVGIGGKGESSQKLRDRLHRYMQEHGISTAGATFYGHVLPSLDQPRWRGNRVAGDGWLAVGDAAGLVDPITGEGIYYAIRSGDLASKIVLDEAHAPADKASAYRSLLARDFTADLEFASTLASRVFLGKFLFGTVPARMIQFIRRSQRFRELIQDLFAGTQPYLELKDRLFRNLGGPFQEGLLNMFLRRVIPDTPRVGL